MYSLNYDDICKLVDEMYAIHGISKKFSRSELHNEVSTFFSGFIISRPKDKCDVESRFENFIKLLEKEKTYEAVVYFPNIIGLPIGTRIGDFEVIDEEISDESFLEFLDYHLEHDRIVLKDRTQARIKFKSYTTTDIQKKLFEYLELPIAIVSFLLDFDINPRNCIGYIKSINVSTIYFIRPENRIYGCTRYRKDYLDKYLEIVSEMTISKTKTNLQKKILQALQIYGLSKVTQKSEIRFLLLISSFESLLLTDNDRDYLGKKLAEKTAFLLEHDGSKRLTLYKRMKCFYNKRSELVHKGKNNISESDVFNVNDIFQGVTYKLLELSITYKKMEQKSNEEDEEGIEDLINNLKFT